MIITYKLKHNRDFTKELKIAFDIADFVVKNKIKSANTKFVKDIRNGLSSHIACQIMRKYGHQKNIKKVHNANLIVPGQNVKYFEDTNSIWIACLKLHLESNIPFIFTKINQVILDKEYAYIALTVKENPEMIPQQFIGIDRNTTGHIVVTANPETGKIEKFGKMAQHLHKKYSAIRKRLQTQGKFREQKTLKNRENRISTNLNHKISRKIVDMAKEQNAAIVFENLDGIQQNKISKKNRSLNNALHSWSYYQLKTFVDYKAKLLGVPVFYVDPTNTSQECSRCGSKGQRKGKEFKCPACGHVDHADVNAAFNIALRQKSMVDCMQKEMCTMGALIPHDALLECEATLESLEDMSVRTLFHYNQHKEVKR